MAVNFGGIPVKGSPLALGVGPVGPTPPPRAVGKGLESGRVGEKSTFTVSSSVQPRVSVEAAEGNVDVQIQSHKPGEYQVSYMPKWVGTYDIIITIGPNDVSILNNIEKFIFIKFVLASRFTIQTKYSGSFSCKSNRRLESVLR